MDNKIILSNQEEKLILYLRELKSGKVEITISDGQPIYADKVKERIKFTK